MKVFRKILNAVPIRDACFIVKDHAGMSLAYVYFEDEPGRRAAAHLLSLDEPRRIAALTKPPALECHDDC